MPQYTYLPANLYLTILHTCARLRGYLPTPFCMLRRIVTIIFATCLLVRCRSALEDIVTIGIILFWSSLTCIILCLWVYLNYISLRFLLDACTVVKENSTFILFWARRPVSHFAKNCGAILFRHHVTSCFPRAVHIREPRIQSACVVALAW